MARKRKNGGAKIGDNSNLREDEKFRLLGFVTEIKRIEDEKATLAEQIKEIYTEAKDRGFNTKAIRHIIKQRKTPKDEREAFQVVVDAYMHALGDFVTTPLGQAMAPQQPNA